MAGLVYQHTFHVPVVQAAAAGGSPPDQWQVFGGIQDVITPSDWGPSVQFVLRVHGAAAVGTFKAHLYNVTDSSIVSGSTVLIMSATKTMVRSSLFSITPDTTKTYEVRFGGQPGDDYTCYDAALWVYP